MISTSSFTPSSSRQSDTQERQTQNLLGDFSQGQEPETVEALLFPAFRHFKGLRSLSAKFTPNSESGYLKGFISENLTASSPAASSRQVEDDRATTSVHYWESSPITNPTVLICSHGSRDSRCGVLGPVLHDEFKKYIAARRNAEDNSRLRLRVSQGARFIASGPEHREPNPPNPQDQETGEPTLKSHPSSPTNSSASIPSSHDITINVGMISHIGGHKWAGNVIIYIPPTLTVSHLPPPPRTNAQEPSESTPHPLAGMGIWYARVEPRHVEGIIEQTILKGNVILDLFRGGLDSNGKLIRV